MTLDEWRAAERARDPDPLPPEILAAMAAVIYEDIDGKRRALRKAKALRGQAA